MSDKQDDPTEIVEMGAQKVSGVASPANGTSFLLVKGAEAECSTCNGSGKILEGHRKCPDCSSTEKSNSAEADAIEEEVTESEPGVIKTADDLDKALSSADRAKMPNSSFAYVDPEGGKHLPVHDESHTKAAIGRFNQQNFSEAKDPAAAKRKAAKKILSAAKSYGIEVGSDSNVAEAAKKGSVQDALNGTQTPVEGGHLETGTSGAAGSVTQGKAPTPADSSQFEGGHTTVGIPDEVKVNIDTISAPSDPAGITKAYAVASLSAAMDRITEIRALQKAGKFLETTGDATEVPGSMPWESFDSATLGQVATCLAASCEALDCIAKRERIEAAVGNVSDLSDAWSIEETESALESALGIVARLAFHEAVSSEGGSPAEKAYDKLDGSIDGMKSVRDELNVVIDGALKNAGNAGSNNDTEVITVEVTKAELADMIEAGYEQREKSAKKQAKKERKRAEKEKTSNNDGEVTPQAGGDVDAELNGIPGGGDVNSEYVNKETDELLKSVTEVIEPLAKGLAEVQETVAKIAKRPRSGGPSLDGLARGAVSPATEGRQSDVSKGEGDSELDTLTKAYEDAKNPQEKDQAGYELTLASLRKAHEVGQL